MGEIRISEFATEIFQTCSRLGATSTGHRKSKIRIALLAEKVLVSKDWY